MRLVGLIRVSTEGQAAEGRAGIASQKAAIEQTAKAQGAELIKIVTVTDVSGSDLGLTSEWSKVVPLLKKGAHLAVSETTRIARPDRFDFSLMATLQATGTKVYTPSGPMDLSTPEGYLTASMGAVVGGFQKMDIKRKTWAAKEAKRRRGEFVAADFCLPLGCTFDRESRSWNYNSDKWKPARAFELLVKDGEENLAAIGREIGVTRAGVRVILANAIYKGWFIIDQKRGTEAYPSKNGRQPERKKVQRVEDEIIRVQVFGLEGQESALVDEVAWQRAQEILRRKKEHHRKRRVTSRPMIWASGFLFSNHGSGKREQEYPPARDHVLYGKVGHGGGAGYYVCRCGELPVGNKDRCGLRLPLLEANRAFDDLFFRVCSHKGIVAKIAAQARAKVEGAGDQREELEVARRAVKAKLDKLVGLLLDDRIDRATYDKRYEALQAELEGLEVRLEGLGQGPSPAKVEKAVRAHLQGLTFKASWSPEKKRAWLSKYVEGVMVSRAGVGSVMLKLPAEGWAELGLPMLFMCAYTWKSLLGHGLYDQGAKMRARLEAQGVLRISEVASRLGVNVNTFKDWLKKNRVPRPAGKHGRWLVWSEAELEATRAYLAAQRSEW